MRLAQPGDVVMLVSDRDRKRFMMILTPGRSYHTHQGELRHDELIGQPIGAEVKTHLGISYYLLTPTTDDVVTQLKRRSQIIFPKDAGYIIMKLGVVPGSRVIEAGSGSGGLTTTLATFVGDSGHVYSYDIREDLQQLAEANIHRAALDGRVDFHLHDATTGFLEEDVDALFLDLPKPWEVLNQARAALRGGGMLGMLVPTVNQLVTAINTLATHRRFAFIEAEELLLREYKVVPARVRPDDRMIGHTGFLVFARAIIPERSLPEDKGES